MAPEHETGDPAHRPADSDPGDFPYGPGRSSPVPVPVPAGGPAAPPPAHVARERDEVDALRARIQGAVDATERAAAEGSLARAKGKGRMRRSAGSLGRILSGGSASSAKGEEERKKPNADQATLERARRDLLATQAQKAATRLAQQQPRQQPQQPVAAEQEKQAAEREKQAAEREKQARADDAAIGDAERQAAAKEAASATPEAKARRRRRWERRMQARLGRCVCIGFGVLVVLALLTPLFYYATLAVLTQRGDHHAERMLWDFTHIGGRGDDEAQPPAEAAGRGQWRWS